MLFKYIECKWYQLILGNHINCILTKDFCFVTLESEICYYMH